jgi:hypothetical protein
MGYKRNTYIILVGIPAGKRAFLEGIGVNGRIILKRIVKN